MKIRLSETFGLREAISRASELDPTVCADFASRWARIRRRRRAALVLWRAGESAEALLLAEAATVDALRTAEEAGQLLEASRPPAAELADEDQSEAEVDEAPESLGDGDHAAQRVPADDEDPRSADDEALPLAEADEPAPNAVAQQDAPRRESAAGRGGAASDIAAVVGAVRARPPMPEPLEGNGRRSGRRLFKSRLRALRALDRVMRPWVLGPRGLRWLRIRRVALAVGAVLLVVGLFAGIEARRQYELNAPWTVSYFRSMDFRGQPIRATAHQVREDWGMEAPSGLPVDRFSARWQSCLVLSRDQVVDLSLGSDDGSRVRIDNAEVLTNWGPHGMRWVHAHPELSAGVHPIRVDYFESAGAAAIALRFGTDGSSFEGEFVRPDIDGQCPDAP